MSAYIMYELIIVRKFAKANWSQNPKKFLGIYISLDCNKKVTLY